MSVKTMTVEQLQNDLAVIARMFPDGIPAEQYDRVNAIKSELKRRGADVAAIPRPQIESDAKSLSVRDMEDDVLAKEFRRLSERLGRDPKDEDLQNRFADVRFELRRRSRSAPEAREQLSPKEQVTALRKIEPRQIEIPEEITASGPPPQQYFEVPEAMKMAPDRTMYGVVRGINVLSDGDGGIVVNYGSFDKNGVRVEFDVKLTPSESEVLASLLLRAAAGGRS